MKVTAIESILTVYRNQWPDHDMPEVDHAREELADLQSRLASAEAAAQAAGVEMRESLLSAIEEASIFCLGCAKKETIVVPSRSGIVGLAAVHSSGMICIPTTVKELFDERSLPLPTAALELDRVKIRQDEVKRFPGDLEYKLIRIADLERQLAERSAK